MTQRGRRLVIGILCGLAAVTAAHAEEEGSPTLSPGAALVAQCTSPDDRVEADCLSYIGGFLAGWQATIETAREADAPADRLPVYCLPDGGTLGQVRDAVVKGMSAMPDRGGDQGGHLLVIAILRKAYPCAAGEAPR